MTAALPPPLPASRFRFQREPFFFGLGMILLPIFWAWWTLQRRFTQRERLMAFAWANVYVLLVVLSWPYSQGRILGAVYGWPHLCNIVAVVLFLLLVARHNILMVLIVMDPLAILISMHPSRMPGAEWVSLFWVIVISLAHLLMTACRRWKAEAEAEDPGSIDGGGGC